MIIRPCTFDGCTVMTIGSRCVEHDVPVTRSFVRGRPFLNATLDAIGACSRHTAIHRHHLARPVSAHGRRVRAPVAPPTASRGGCAYTSTVRRYHLTTFGCQMNSHDSERIKGMLESLGMGEAVSKEDADLVVFNTCTIREKPDTKLSAYLGDAGARKRENPDLVIAVGGCFAEAQQEKIFDLYPQVDVAFGPGSIPHLGEWVGTGGAGVDRGRFGTHEHFAGHLPQHRDRPAHAWVQSM